MNVGLVDGFHDVYFVFTGGSGGILNANWFGFSEEFICNNTAELIEAECYDDMEGVQTEGSTEGTLNVGWIQNGDWTMYNDIDLSDMKSIKARVSGNTTGNKIEVRLDGVNGDLVAEIPVTNTGGNQVWVTDRSSLVETSGLHDVYLVFVGGAGYMFNINYLEFSQDEVLVTNIESMDSIEKVIYPNPSSGVVNLGANTVYAVTNSLGQMVLEGKGEQVDLSSYAEGVYVLKIGQKLYKILKQ